MNTHVQKLILVNSWTNDMFPNSLKGFQVWKKAEANHLVSSNHLLDLNETELFVSSKRDPSICRGYYKPFLMIILYRVGNAVAMPQK